MAAAFNPSDPAAARGRRHHQCLRHPAPSVRMSELLAQEEQTEASILSLPQAEKDCWRPTMDDVERISWGRPAKKKGTGSRGMPHRLNDEERLLFDFARRKGFVEIAGSGWRRQRSDAPLVNTWRSWSDACAHPAIYLHKGRDGVDEVVVDLAPLRTPLRFDEAAAFCLSIAPGGETLLEGADEAAAPAQTAEPQDTSTGISQAEKDELESLRKEIIERKSHLKEGGISGEQINKDADIVHRVARLNELKAKENPGCLQGQKDEQGANEDTVVATSEFLASIADAYVEKPIYQCPMCSVSWRVPREAAKQLVKTLAEQLGTAKLPKGRKKGQGLPDVKPGKSRRHSGYGISSKASRDKKRDRVRLKSRSYD